MAAGQDTRNMALFCDFENVALGVREAKYAQFDVGRVLERLLLDFGGSVLLVTHEERVSGAAGRVLRLEGGRLRP